MTADTDRQADESPEPEDTWEADTAACVAYTETLVKSFPPDLSNALNHALYTYSERGLFGDISIRDNELAIAIWAVVEQVRLDGNFPDHLRM